MKKCKIKSIIGVYPNGERQRFSLDNIDEMKVHEFSAVEIVEEITKEEFNKLYSCLTISNK